MSRRKIGVGLSLSFLVVFAGTLWFAQSGLSQEKGARYPLENLVPADAVAFVSLPDLGKAREAFGRTSLQRLLDDPEVKLAVEPLEKWWAENKEQFSEQLTKELGVTFDELWDLFRGQVSIALLDLEFTKGKGGNPPNAVGAIDLAAPPEKVKSLLGNLEKKLKERSPNQKEAFVSQWKRYSVTSLGEEGPHWAVLGETVLFSAQKKSLLDMIDRAEDPSAGKLADFASFRAARSALGTENSFLAYANVQGALKKIESEMDEQARRVVSALGLWELRSLSIGIGFKGNGVVEGFYLHAPGQRTGLLKMLSLKNLEGRAADLVPSGAPIYSAARINLAELYDEALKIVEAIEPDASQQLEEKIEAVEKELGFSIRDDLCEAVGEVWVSYNLFPEGGGVIPDGITIVELKDQARFERCFKKLAQAAGKELKDLSWKGRTIHYLPNYLPQSVAAPMQGLPVQFSQPMAYTLIGNRAYLSPTVVGLKRMFQRMDGGVVPVSADRGQATLAGSEAYRRADSLLGGAAAAEMYWDVGGTFQWIYNSLGSFAVYFQETLDQLGVPLDTQRLPLGETIGQYLDPSLTRVSSDAEGIKVQSYSSTGLTVTGVFGGAIVAAIAVPRLMMARSAAQEVSALSELRVLTTAEFIWRANDSDGNGMNDFWTGDVAGLYAFKDSQGQPVGLIEEALALADASPQQEHDLAGGSPVPKNGYYFSVLTLDDQGNLYQADTDGDGRAVENTERFAFCAWPAQYPATGRLTYMVDESGIVYAKDNGGAAVTQWPGLDPTQSGWQPAR